MSDEELQERIEAFAKQMQTDGSNPAETLGWLIGWLLKDGFEIGLTKDVWMNKCDELWAKMETLVGKQN